MNSETASGARCKLPASDRVTEHQSGNSEEEPSRGFPQGSIVSCQTASEDANETGKFELHAAACGSDEARVKELLARGFDTRARDSSGRTPLHHALSGKRKRLASLLADADSGIDNLDNYGSTPLLYAARNGYTWIVRKLLAAGANVLALDFVGMTPLHRALFGGHDATAKLLVAAGGGNNIRDGYGRTPQDIVSQRGERRELYYLYSPVGAPPLLIGNYFI
ncbi:serine/threonine-protein phosphatase 6 regulatory ankyrin repeat subunit C-like [Uloborus diversus]|uniref:serine/threonine-protein phosphatase 6 regulatory ankyrin repeat subunit C-like n=1 Tax=Uloborus diversus TaxID=327109 RepID=UPI00240A017E|nr:serine/threonine-protein phosphatase 6 regulatory ankyrin repeat subunit C-like [Uloborus diversus]